MHVRNIEEALDFYHGIIGFDVMGVAASIGAAEKKASEIAVALSHDIRRCTGELIMKYSLIAAA